MEMWFTFPDRVVESNGPKNSSTRYLVDHTAVLVRTIHLTSSPAMLPNSLRFRALYDFWSSFPPAYATPRNPDQPAMISCSLEIDKEGSPGTAINSRGSSSPPSPPSEMSAETLTSISSGSPRPSVSSGSKSKRWFIARRVTFPLALLLAGCSLGGAIVAVEVVP